MSALPGGAETGAGVGVAKVATKVSREVIKRVAEVAKTPGKMVTFTRRGKIVGAPAIPDMVNPPTAAGVLGPDAGLKVVTGVSAAAVPGSESVSAPAANVVGAEVINGASPSTEQVPNRTSITRAEDTVAHPTRLKAEADASKVDELTSEAREIAAQAPAGSDVGKAGVEKTTGAVLQQSEEEKQWRLTPRASGSREYKQAMERLTVEAQAKGEDVKDPKVQERMQKQASAEFYSPLAQKTELTAEIVKDSIFAEVYKRALAAAAVKFKRTGEKTDSEAIKNSALAEYLEDWDRAPLTKKAKRWLIKLLKNLGIVVFAGVVGGAVTAGKEETKPLPNPS